MKASNFALIGFAALTLLTACGEKGDGTNISITGTDNNGEAAAATVDGKTGQVKIDVPGFKADINLPKIQLNAGDLDINGVNLYPGSVVTGVNIATDDDANTAGNDSVKIAFDAPADPTKVKAWFAEQMRTHKFTVNETMNGLSGTTDEDEPFTLTLGAGKDGHSAATLEVGSANAGA